jgi:formylglycine-generating enzyme required for sulfatase activity
MELSMIKKIFLMAIIASFVASILMAQEVKPGKVEVIDLGKGIKLELVFIPAGKFKMGSPETERGRQKNESQHEVTITKSFLIGKYEVTQEQWEALMGKNPSVNVGPRLPVTNVSWVECQEFIKVLNLKTKGEYRLPTESEWEYACRAGTNTATAFGETITSKDANYDESKIDKPVPVGSYKPNAFGLYDMHGNVWEWCSDWFANYPDGPLVDPVGAKEGARRVVRGGSFNYFHVSNMRSSYRGDFNLPSSRTIGIGFRLAKTN